jgi:diguanylate cyclase (GGDEF)-like protein/PAS domain S-box-containing protein
MALWQSSTFLQNPVAFLTARLQTLNWPLVIGAIVLLAIAWLTIKKLGSRLSQPRDKNATASFPGEEASFHAAFEDSAFGTALLDKEGRILHANPALQKILGYDFAQLANLPISNFAHPEDAHDDKTNFAELIEGRRDRYRKERRFYDSEGKLLYLRQEVFAPHGVGERFHNATPGTRAAVLLEDVTRRKLAEAELQITREALHNLYQVIVDRDLDLLEKIRALLTMGCRRFNVETGVLGEIVPGGFELLQVVSPDERIRRGKIYERSAEIGDWPEPVFARHMRLPDDESTHLARDWRRFPFYNVADVEAYLSTPVFVAGDLFGVLAFSSVTVREEAFTEADKEYLQLMAQWLGSELERLQARAELEAKQTELIAVNSKLEALATVDGLTGAKNRRALDERLEMELRRAWRYKTPLSVLLLDVDKFKQFNDSFGHLAGDEVLKTVALVLQENVRVIDFVARYGGEEFAVLLPQTDVEGAMIVANRLREKIEAAKWIDRPVTASIGVASLSETMKERAELLAAADRGLYASKEAGRNRCTHANEIKPEGFKIAEVDEAH